MGDKDFALVTKTTFSFVCQSPRLSGALDSPIYTFVYVPIMVMYVPIMVMRIINFPSFS